MVDAAALVSVRSNDLQAPQRSHSISQANVDSTTGHIGRNSDGPGLPRIGYDPCLFLLIAGIQYLVANAANTGAEPLRLSVLVLDIDNFKLRNDTYGHAVGDAALKMLGRVLKHCVRMGDTAARLGGEEFGFLLPDTDVSRAMDLAERIQRLLSQEPQHGTPLTVSVGVASFTTPDVMTSWEQLLCRADDAMYEAKRAGKNRAIHHDGLVPHVMESVTNPTVVPECTY